MKLIANSWNSISSIQGTPNRVEVNATGSRAGLGTMESSAGDTAWSSSSCFPPMAGHVGAKWVGSSFPCSQSLQVEDPTLSQGFF